MECEQPFRIVLLDEVNNERKEQMEVPYRDITWEYAVRLCDGEERTKKS